MVYPLFFLYLFFEVMMACTAQEAGCQPVAPLPGMGEAVPGVAGVPGAGPAARGVPGVPDPEAATYLAAAAEAAMPAALPDPACKSVYQTNVTPTR